MKTYPNQKVVYAQHIAHDKEHPGYGCLNVDAVCMAKRNLSGNAFALYIRCALNNEDFAYALSPKSIHEDLDISKSGYERAVNELIEAGYLVAKKEKSNQYILFERPAKIHEKSIKRPKRAKNGAGHTKNECDITPIKNTETIQETVYNNTNNTEQFFKIYPNEPFIFFGDFPNGWSATNYSKEADWVRSRMKRRYDSMRDHIICRKESGEVLPGTGDAIIKRYCSEHTETKEMTRRGDKYGRWIAGWDNESNEPIIVYPSSYLLSSQAKKMWRIEEVPKEYWWETWIEIKCEKIGNNAFLFEDDDSEELPF